jgi:large subunit ribosomal protein L21
MLDISIFYSNYFEHNTLTPENNSEKINQIFGSHLKLYTFAVRKFSFRLYKRNPLDFRLPEEILKHVEMYAIVEIAGQQMKVEKGRKIYVHRLENAEGETVVFDKVLLVDNEGAVKVGTPVVEGASVTASVVEHVKGDKVLVFKKKRRKGYQKMNGHRQFLTKIQIEEVIG